MSLDNVERLYLERQITMGRAVLVSLSLVVLLETSQEPVRRASVVFLFAYLGLALAGVVVDRFFPDSRFRIPLAVDCVALAAFFYLTPSVSAFWFLFLFAAFALATRGKAYGVLALVVIATAGVIIRVALADPFRWQSVWHWLAIGFGTLVSGLGMGFLGAREGDHLSHQRFIEKVTGLLHFDRGLTESVRQALGELALEFECEQACLAVRDDELERLFVWKVRPNDRESAEAETLPLSRSDAFLIDTLEVSLGWAFKNGNGTGEGFGWDRRSGAPFRSLPVPPDSARSEFAARELMAATIEADGRPAGRVLLVNPKQHFSTSDLRYFEQIVRHIGPPLENIFLLRNLRARAVESERSRISRDLHDGILQTLLSMNIQLDVLRRKAVQAPQQVADEMAGLQKILQHESQEFRRMVTDMRPLRVESADMRELMLGFAERFRNESGIAIDLFIEDRNLRLPDRLCRELFQIYRESLHNIKKHANASHVVVKLGQDETKVALVVDDNGSGFSFSGRFTNEELDRLRLGPISIKERTRSVGGTLTVESNPGHGARLTIEIPLN
ncbi:MAG TPA: sensor histidine kinase [Candidatus Limnocylindrales bacterium]|nr:sensor histidine kinase [Candidatus Limnocylindrales bacterium]